MPHAAAGWGRRAQSWRGSWCSQVSLPLSFLRTAIRRAVCRRSRGRTRIVFLGVSSIFILSIVTESASNTWRCPIRYVDVFRERCRCGETCVFGADICARDGAFGLGETCWYYYSSFGMPVRVKGGSHRSHRTKGDAPNLTVRSHLTTGYHRAGSELLVTLSLSHSHAPRNNGDDDAVASLDGQHARDAVASLDVQHRGDAVPNLRVAQAAASRWRLASGVTLPRRDAS